MIKIVDTQRCSSKVLFVDSKYFEKLNVFVESNLTPEEQSRVVLQPWSPSKLSKWKYFNQTQQIFHSNKRKEMIKAGKNTPLADLALYCPLTLYKMVLMNMVIATNPFQSGSFYWVDSGECWDAIDWKADFNALERLTSGSNPKWYLTKFMITYGDVHGFDPALFQQEVGYKPKWAIPRAGLFGGSKAAFDIIYPLYIGVLERTLSLGALGTEESILAIAFAHRPDLWLFPELDPWHSEKLRVGCPAWSCINPTLSINCTYLVSNRVTMNWKQHSNERRI